MHPSHPDAWTRVFVYGATVLMCGAAGWYTHTQGTDLPVRDEWYLIPQWLASDSTGEWAMAHHNEHRYPVGKLLWLGAVRACGDNLKAPMYGTVGLLTAAAVLLQWAAGRVRGRGHPLDALYPVLLLHWGNGLNLIFGYQIGHALFVYALAGWAWAASRVATGGGPGWAAVSAVYAAVVVSCGGYGLAFTPSVVAWFVYLTVRYGRGGRWGWAVGFATAGLAVGAYSRWVYATMPPTQVPGISPTAEPHRFAAGVIAFLESALGDMTMWDEGWKAPGVSPEWGVGPVLLGGVVCAVYAVGLAAAGWRAVRGDRRAVWVAVGLQVVGGLLIAAAVVRGRGSVQAWYVTVSAAGLAGAVFGVSHHLPTVLVRWSRRRLLLALDLSAVPRRWGDRVWAGVVVALAGLLFWANHAPGLETAFVTRVALADIRNDVAAGYPASFIVGRHGSTYPVLMGDGVATYMIIYRDAGWPQFRNVAAEPPVAGVPVAGVRVPFDLSNDPNRGVARVELPTPPPRALAVRFRVTSVDSTGWQRVGVKWTDADTGLEQTAEANPPYSNGLTTHLVFPLTGRPVDLRFVPVSTIKVVRIEAADWLVLPPE